MSKIDYRLEVEKEWLDCEECDLCHERTNVVLGIGSANAPLVFVGEGPGELEDKEGIPFIGKSGQVLNMFIEFFGYARQDLFVDNVVMCRPPNNRDPKLTEIATCTPRLLQVLYHIDPLVVVALGGTAFKALTGSSLNISKARKLKKLHFATVNTGMWTEPGEDVSYPVIPTFHPSYLSRTVGIKNKPGSPWEMFHNDVGFAFHLLESSIQLYSGKELEDLDDRSDEEGEQVLP